MSGACEVLNNVSWPWDLGSAFARWDLKKTALFHWRKTGIVENDIMMLMVSRP